MKHLKYLSMALALALVVFSSFSVKTTTTKQLDPRILEYIEDIVVDQQVRLKVGVDVTQEEEGIFYNCDALPVNDFCTVQVDDASHIYHETSVGNYFYILPADKIDDTSGKFELE